MSFAATYIDSWRRATADVNGAAIDRAVGVLTEARHRDAMVWTAGNGGSGTLASHLAIGLTLNTRRSGGRPFRASCLGADAATLSAAANDFGAEDALRVIFECNARRGDVLCVFSVSGESTNVNNTITAATEIDVPVIAVVGSRGSTAAQLADHPIVLGSLEPGIAEDLASAIMHALYCTFMYEGQTSPPAEFANAS